MNEVPLTPEQQRAADPSGRYQDTCVVAGPGSGKTTVLVEYFRRLVVERVDPLRILAITFTEKAAGNMRKKLAEAFPHDPATRALLERAWVSTVHGFCSRLLHENAIFAGVDPEFSVADERESSRLQQESIDAAVSEEFAGRPAAVRALIRGLSSFEFEDAVLAAYDAMRGAGMSLDEVAAKAPPAGTTVRDVADTLRALRRDGLDGWTPSQRAHLDTILEEAERVVTASSALERLRAVKNYSGNLRKCRSGTSAYNLVTRLRDQLKDLPYSLITELYAQERNVLLAIFRRFDRIYRERKRQSGLLDFADLEEFTVRLLEESPETRARLQQQFDHIVMDEFQDTNGQQARLLELVRRPDRFYAVGDINQSIFGFRHAEPEVFRNYRDTVEQSGRRLIELVDNFRSRPEILRAVETLAEGAAGIEPRDLVAGREFTGPRPVCVEVMSAVGQDVDTALETEARWVARRILELVDEGDPAFAFRDVAVLVRNTEVIPDFTDAFDEAGVPYVVNRGRGFYEAREIKDLVHLLRVIANPRDELSLAAVLRSPLAYVSDEGLLQLRIMGDNIGAALLRLGKEAEREFAPEDYAKLIRFRNSLAGWRKRREHVSFDRLLLAAIDDCGYQCDSGARGWGNVEKLLAQARDAAGRMSFDDFVRELEFVRSSNLREADAPPEDSANAVNVMTVHSAKGLEFPVVFVAALHKGIETSPPVVAFSREYGLGARWRNPATGQDKDDLFQHAIREERKKREAEESDRLLYVATTRAEQHLVLSFSGNGKKPGNWAGVVCDRLHVDATAHGDETLTRTAPNGETWKLRVVVAERPPERLAGPGTAEVAGDIEYVRAPEITEQQDANATVTALAAFAKCPRSYFLEHYLGFEGHQRRVDAQQPAASELGSQVHALLAGAAVADPDPKAVALADVFRQSPLGRRLARASRLEREFDFLMDVDGLVLRGQIDLWFEEGGDLVIVDYKTDSVTAIEAHQRALDYAPQLRLYALALERITGRAPSHAWLYFLKPNTPMRVDLTPSLLDSPEQLVREFQEAQSVLEFPLREGSHCRRCPFYRNLCPALTEPAGAPAGDAVAVLP